MIRLKEIRQKQNLTQKDVAEMLGISRSSYTNYETGKREPDLTTLSKMSDIFHVSTDYLLGKSNDDAEIERESIFYRFSKEAKELNIDERDIANFLNLFREHQEKNKRPAEGEKE